MSWKADLTLYIKEIVDSLYKCGIKDVVISPGSRSTPFAYAFVEHPGIETHIVIDERSAAFFALGMAKKNGFPVVLLCTSGTAAANYYPAIIEAKYARVPLIVLTADRPHELREVGAPQTIDQIHLYGKQVKWFVDLPKPGGDQALIPYLRQTARKCVQLSQEAPKGPVHVNIPLPEPLIPELPMSFQLEREGDAQLPPSRKAPAESMVFQLKALLTSGKKGLIICGQLDDQSAADSIRKFSSVYQIPVLADPLSQLRKTAHDGAIIIDAYDTLLRINEIKERLACDFVIRFGAMPVSKSLTLFLKNLAEDVPFIVIDEGGGRDPIHRATDVWNVNESLLIKECIVGIDEITPAPSEWAHNWISLNQQAKKLIQLGNKDLPWHEGSAVQTILESLPSQAVLFVGNSMPIRDIDTFYTNETTDVEIIANRGANGIDGVVSSALGAAKYHQPAFLLIGDLSFYHDLNGLLISKMEKVNLTIFVLNNNGGGIFSFLPQAEEPHHFEKLFGTPASLQFKQITEMYDGHYMLVSNREELQVALQSMNTKTGLKVFEVMTNRETNVQSHRDLWKFVSKEIQKDE